MRKVHMVLNEMMDQRGVDTEELARLLNGENRYTIEYVNDVLINNADMDEEFVRDVSAVLKLSEQEKLEFAGSHFMRGVPLHKRSRQATSDMS